jgi:hypothetical protein
VGVTAKVKVDFKGLEKFAKQLNKLNKEQIELFSEKSIKELAARLLAKVIKRTPVGEYDKPVTFTVPAGKNVKFTTKSGKVVNFVTKNSKTVTFTPHTGKKGGTLRRGWTIGNVTKSSDGYMVEIINPTEYASYVEFGHRTRGGKGWVNGKFMMTISEQELEADAPKILEAKLNKFLGEVFNA